jgi:hypothetical protein
MVKRPELDYDKLVGFLNKKTEEKPTDKIAVSAVRNRMHKIAFDVYSIEDDPYDGLWKLESEDGKDYLVRIDGENSTPDLKNSGWSATSNESGNSITLAYRGVPVQRLSGKIFGFNKRDVGLFKQALVEKVANDETFKNKIIDMQTDERKAELVSAFPELAVRKS